MARSTIHSGVFGQLAAREPVAVVPAVTGACDIGSAALAARHRDIRVDVANKSV